MKWFFTVLMVLGALSVSWGQTLVRYSFDGESPSHTEVAPGMGALSFSASANGLGFANNPNPNWTAPQASSANGWNAPNAGSGKYFSFTFGPLSAEEFSIGGISFTYRSNNNTTDNKQGPTAYEVTINGSKAGEGALDFNTVAPITIPVTGFDNLTIAEVRIIGYEGFIPTNGEAAFLIDDVTVTGNVFFPITLSSFTARPSGKSVQLDWRTATELNNDYMEVQHSTDGRHYSKIGSVQGAGTTQEEQTYAFRHETPASGINYYRLLQVDYDGAYEYHGPVSVRMNGEKGGQLSLFPTVASETVEVQYEGTLSSEAEWQVIDLNGRVWQQQRWEAKSASFSLPVQDLPAGMYLLRLQQGREVETVRFVKQ